MNYSRQREIILDALRANAIHPTAESLYKIIKDTNNEYNIGIATVYRNLKKMSECGEIKKISGLEDAEHFDHNTHNHYHFICNECKQIFDIDSDIAPDIINKIHNKTSFKITSHDIIFHGICKRCQDNK